jgi:hypothetical protein
VLVTYGNMANYNGLITSVQHRLSSTFSLLANYTWSKCLNIYDAQGDYAGTGNQNPAQPRLDYGPCGSDYRNVENVVLVLKSNFPIGNRFAALLVNNWEFAPLLHIVSGAPFNVTSGQDNSFTDVGNDRPNQVSGTPIRLNQTLRSGAGQANRGFLNPAAFAQVTAGCPTPLTPATCPGYGTYGNISRDAFRGPNLVQFDAQISRIFPIHESIAATLRLEAFNVPNHPNFATPAGAGGSSAALTSSTFGQISALASGQNPRIFQGSVKITF